MRLGFATILIGAAVGFSQAATAADLPTKAPILAPAPIVASTWTGFYVGGHVGRHTARTNGIFDNGGSDPQALFGDFNLDGWNGGIQGGYDYQWNYWVVGVVGDYTWARKSSSFVDGEDDLQKLSLRDFASVRGRLGVAATILNGTPLLAYGTAGYGWGKLKWSVENGAATGDIKASGLVYGGGTEVKLTPNISFFTEYLIYDFNKTFDFNAAGVTDADAGDYLKFGKIHNFRAGLNLRF